MQNTIPSIAVRAGDAAQTKPPGDIADWLSTVTRPGGENDRSFRLTLGSLLTR